VEAKGLERAVAESSSLRKKRKKRIESSIKKRSRIKTHLTLPQQTEQLSTSHKVHHHVQVLGVAERSPEVDEERMSNPDEHLSFRVGVLDLLHSNDLLLPEDLHGVEPSVVTRFDEMDSTEGSGSEAGESEARTDEMGRKG